jgi:CSLREA domain-containing protein
MLPHPLPIWCIVCYTKGNEMFPHATRTDAPTRVVHILIAMLLLTTLAATPNITYATALTVTRFDDPAPNSCQPGDCSLREAIIATNAATGRDTIVLSPGTYTLSIAGTGEDAGTAGDLDITGDIALIGAGAGVTMIDANQIDRVLDILSGDVTIAAVTFQHGAAGSQHNGGGIRNAGMLTLSASAVLSSTAGVFLDFHGGSGGGISSTGALQLTDSTIGGNTADSHGGGIFSSGSLTITHSVLTGNTAAEASGGGLETKGHATIRDSLITRNKTYGSDGGISNNGTLELINSQVTYNSASEGQSRGGGIGNDGTLTVTASLIGQNHITSTYGGGLYNSGQATFIDSAIKGNAAFDGPGGVYNMQGMLTFLSSTIAANTSQYGPTGIENEADLMLLDSTVAANSIHNSRVITATNSTFSAAAIENTGRMVVGNATITNADVAITNSGAIELRNTILAGNAVDCMGPIVSGGHNMLGNVTGCSYTEASGDLIGTSSQAINPRLGPLQRDRGVTATHAPLSDSPAIDAGDNVTCTLVDQRGVVRPQGLACDIGAVEVEHYAPRYLPVIRT